MALRYGFYNSINHDRKYDALDMSSIFDGIIEDGVFATIGKLFAVTPGEGLQVIVDTGKAWFNHTWSSNDAPIPLSIDTPDITLARYDAVVLEINNTESVRANSIKIIKGTAASDPQKPVMANTDLVHQYPLAYILVENSATSIKGSNIHMAVGTEECPFVTGPLETVSIEALFSRWESEFDDWFTDVRTTLDGDVAGNLLRKIYDLDDKIDDRYEKTLNAEAKELYKLPPDATPSDVFVAIKNQLGLIMNNNASVTVTLKTPGGTPLEGIPIMGLLSSSGSPGVVTNKSGVATGIVSSGSVKLSVSGYADLSAASVSFTAVKGETYSKELVVNIINFVKYTASKKIKFSKNVETVDAAVVAAGGGGSGSVYKRSSSEAYSGAGGGAGSAAIKTGISITPDTQYQVTVGAGGDGGAPGLGEAGNGKDGGASSFGSFVSASGGKGGVAPYVGDRADFYNGVGGSSDNGAGANGVHGDSYGGSLGVSAKGKPGGAGVIDVYSSFSETEKSGGGGASGGVCGSSGTGGTPGGGDGGNGGRFDHDSDPTVSDGSPGVNGLGGGGGGGGGKAYSGNGWSGYQRVGGAGGSGSVRLRIHCKVTA